MMYSPETMPLAFGALMLFLAIWELAWKGKGLWKAAQKKHLYWFVAMLVINSLGILPIIYLAFFAKKK